MAHSSPADRYNFENVLNYINQVEEAYSVSIKFWYELTRSPDGEAVRLFGIMCSGEAVDLLPNGVWPPHVGSTVEEPESEGWCVYHLTARMERLLNQVREPIGSRPALR